jgi:hypothetical protein
MTKILMSIELFMSFLCLENFEVVALPFQFFMRFLFNILLTFIHCHPFDECYHIETPNYSLFFIN